MDDHPTHLRNNSEAEASKPARSSLTFVDLSSQEHQFHWEFWKRRFAATPFLVGCNLGTGDGGGGKMISDAMENR